MIKYPKSSQLAAKAHKFAVNSLVGLTGVGLAVLSVQVYIYFTAVRPEVNQQKIAEQTAEQTQ